MRSLQSPKACPAARSTRCQAVRVSWSSWGVESEPAEVARGASNILPVISTSTIPAQAHQGPSHARQEQYQPDVANLPTRSHALQHVKSALPGTARQLTAKLSRCQHWRELQALLHSHAQHMNALHLSALVTRLAKVAPIQSRSASHALDKDLEAFMQDVSALVSRNLDNLDPRGLVNILWSVARLGYRPSYTLVQRYLFAAFVHMPNMKPQEISNLLWAIATMDIKPGSVWLQHLIPHATATVSEMKPQELANFTWAISKLCTGSNTHRHTDSDQSTQMTHGSSRDQLSCLVEAMLKTSLGQVTAFQPFEHMMLVTSFHRLLGSMPLPSDLGKQQCQQQDSNVHVHHNAQSSSSSNSNNSNSTPASFAAERIQSQLVRLLYSRLLAASADHLSPALASCHILSSQDAANLVCLLAWDVKESTAGQQVWNSATGRLAVLHTVRAVARAGHVLLLSCSRKGLVRLLWGLSILDARMPAPWLQACLHAVCQTFSNSNSSNNSSSSLRGCQSSNDVPSSLAKILWAAARLHKSANQMPAGRQVNSSIQTNNSHVSHVISQQPPGLSESTLANCNSTSVSTRAVHTVHETHDGLITHSDNQNHQHVAQTAGANGSRYESMQRPGALSMTGQLTGSTGSQSAYLMLPPALQSAITMQLEHMPLQQLSALACSLGSLPYRLQPKLVQSLQHHIHRYLQQVDAQQSPPASTANNAGQTCHQPSVPLTASAPQQHVKGMQLRHVRLLMIGVQRLNIALSPDHMVALSQLLCSAIRQHACHHSDNKSPLNLPLISIVMKQFMTLCSIHRQGNRQLKQPCRQAVVLLLECVHEVQQPSMACCVLRLLAQLRIMPQEATHAIRCLVEDAILKTKSMSCYAFSQLLVSSARLGYSAATAATGRLLQQRLHHYDVSDVATASSLLWALTKMKARISRAFLQQLASHLEHAMSLPSQQHVDKRCIPTAGEAVNILWALQQYKVAAPTLCCRLFEVAISGVRQLTPSQALRLLRTASGSRRRLLRAEWRAMVRQAAGRSTVTHGSPANRPAACLLARGNRKHMQSLKYTMHHRSMSWSQGWPTWVKIRKAISTRHKPSCASPL